MNIKVLFYGFPGKITRGYMSWSSIVYIETAEKKILFDTGSMVERSVLPVRMKKYGIDIVDIDTVVLSHFHHDHASNIDYFKNARILLHENECKYIESNPEDWALLKYMYLPLKQSGQLVVISGEPEICPGVKIIMTPGHTPGCISLVLQEENKPVIVLAGDAVKNLAELSTGKVAMSLNNEASSQSIKRIRNIADIVVPGHDRVLKIEQDRIAAITTSCEIITVPAGICSKKSYNIKLQIGPSEILKKNNHII
jgi:glyoxylase-like metal-dependent hydrolase (beta-lactamase superfamily II)